MQRKTGLKLTGRWRDVLWRLFKAACISLSAIERAHTPSQRGDQHPGDRKTVQCGIEGLLSSVRKKSPNVTNDHLITKFKGTILLGTPNERDKSYRNPEINVTDFTSDSIAAQLTGNQLWHPFSAERSTHMQSTFHMRPSLRSQKRRWLQWGIQSPRSRSVGTCNSHTKPMARHFYRLIYF